jgi:NADH-quinone oxidoreductase subunit C
MSNISTFDKLSNLVVYSNTNNNSEALNANLFSVNTYVITPRQELRSLAAFLKLNSLSRVTNAIDISIVDSISNELRFNINYQLQSSTTNTRWVLSTWVSETKSLLSLQTLYPAFNWAEREVWDMYGVFFVKHPDLRRILTDYGFVGFPLRKDFPLSGFREVQYEDSIKQVEYSNAELTQSYRLLSFTNPWTK